jgi:hypothetical protein
LTSLAKLDLVEKRLAEADRRLQGEVEDFGVKAGG